MEKTWLRGLKGVAELLVVELLVFILRVKGDVCNDRDNVKPPLRCPASQGMALALGTMAEEQTSSDGTRLNSIKFHCQQDKLRGKSAERRGSRIAQNVRLYLLRGVDSQS
jgi:hypothetical protein